MDPLFRSAVAPNAIARAKKGILREIWLLLASKHARLAIGDKACGSLKLYLAAICAADRQSSCGPCWRTWYQTGEPVVAVTQFVRPDGSADGKPGLRAALQHVAIRHNNKVLTCGCSSVGRATRCQRVGRGSESHHPLCSAVVRSRQPESLVHCRHIAARWRFGLFAYLWGRRLACHELSPTIAARELLSN
jgi:hypothetical protein